MEKASYKNVCELAMLFHPETFIDESSWIDLGKILYQQENKLGDIPKNTSLLDLWIQVSEQVPGYEECSLDDCTYYWNCFSTEHYNIVNNLFYTYNVLVEYVKQDNPDEYNKWLDNAGYLKNEKLCKKEYLKNSRNTFHRFKKDCIHKSNNNVINSIDDIYSVYSK